MIVEEPNRLWLREGAASPALEIHHWVKPPFSIFYIVTSDKK